GDECLEAVDDQAGEAPAQHRLLSKEVGLGLLGEGGLDEAGPRGADAVGVGDARGLGLPGGVLVDGDEGRRADALGVGPADKVAGTLGGDQNTSMSGDGWTRPKWMLNPWAQARALPGSRLGPIASS